MITNKSFYLNPFKSMMTKLFSIIFILMISNQVLAQNLEVTCADNQCNSINLANQSSTCASIVNKTQCEAKVSGNLCQWIDDANPNGGFCTSAAQQKICAGYNCPLGESMSVVKVRGLLDLDFNVLTTSTGRPQNFGFVINAGAYPGKNGNISLAAQTQGYNSANVILIGDNFNNLNINLDGYNGKKGKDASEICADKIKSGIYGTALQSYFNNRRSTTAADPNRCDADDLNYIQTFNFTCDDPAYQEVATNNPIVQVSQIKKLARCNAVASYNLCVKRKVNVTCNYRLWSTFRQKFITDGENFSGNSYYNGPVSYRQEIQSCGQVQYNCNCYYSSGGFFGGGYVCETTATGPNSSNSNNTFDYKQCSYYSNGSQIPSCSGSTSYSINQELFYLATVQVTPKIPGMPITKSRSVGPFEEEFVNSEVRRLGNLDKFCDVYGQLPPKNNAEYWAGASGAPAPSNNSNGSQANGIPLEIMGSVSGFSATEPYGAVFNWKDDTRQNGGYEPIVSRTSTYTSNGSGFGGTTTYHYTTRSAYWKGQGSTSALTAPGLNADGVTLANGSIWETRQTNTFENCPAGWSNLKNIFINLVQFTNKENTSCSGISDPLDPNNRAFWQYTGITQEPTFGTETVSCGIGSCAVNSTVSELARSLDVISPASGESGTEQGRGLLFVYDIKNINGRALPGGSGAVGTPDININPQERICVKIDDANAGINTEQAKNPFVSFRRYQWRAIRSIDAGNPGTPPRNTGKEIEVFKKIDPAARFLLDKSLL